MHLIKHFLIWLVLSLSANAIVAQSTIFAQAADFLPHDTIVQSAPTVTYHSLSIIPTGRKAVLNWATTAERHNVGFEVQYQRQGRWQKVGFQAGALKSRHLQYYRFCTESLPPGLHQFRLCQWSSDGKFAYSAPLRVRVEDRTLVWEIAANKTGPVINMVINSAYSEDFLLSLFDDYGQLIYQQHLNKPAGSHQVSVDLTAVYGKAYHWQLHNKRGSWHQALSR
ncbi:MAG: hypothetical protein AAFY48_13805 [Bacteroidota bacterium]